MKNRKILLPALRSIALVFSLILPASVLNITSVMAQGNVTPLVAAGSGHTMGLKSDGTVVSVGHNLYGRCDVNGWTDIKQIAAGREHTVGLKSDGTVVAVGDNDK
jgi:alpha-tubulin suppressor-like RCC1 family protein